MKLYALIGSTAFAVNDLNELITDTEKDVIVFSEIITWYGSMFSPGGSEISEIIEEW